MPKDEPKSKIRCVKCGSEDVLAGSGANPHRCSDCNHKWKPSEKKDVILGCEDATCESVTHPPIFRPQSVLFTLNKNYRRDVNLKTRIDEALQHI